MELYFENNALEEARYFSPFEKKVRICRRGGFATYGVSPFRWCATVAAVSLTFVKAKYLFLTSSLTEPILEGQAGTPAHTLGLAIYRPSLWIWDLFGITADGRNLLLNILHISNNRFRKRKAFVKIFYRGNFLPPTQIRIFNNGVELSRPSELLDLISVLDREFSSLLGARAKLLKGGNKTSPIKGSQVIVAESFEG